MSLFVKHHVERLFKEAGFEILEIYGDRSGTAQGDGLDLVVTPDVETLAKRFSNKRSVIRAIVDDNKVGRRLEVKLYGGSSSTDLDGVRMDLDFVLFARDRAREVYEKAQKDIDAIFDAEDAPLSCGLEAKADEVDAPSLPKP